MRDLFLNIEGLYSENLTTEILAIILNKDEFAVYQRLFYNYLLGREENRTTLELKFKVEPQVSFDDGQPDILITGENEVYIIENKFYAGFSKGNQILRYKKIIKKNFSSYREAKVIILTIADRVPYYQSLLKSEPDIKFIIWEEILKLFESNNFLIEALSGYIQERFITKLEFTKEQLEMLKDINTPKAIKEVMLLIEKTKDELRNMGLKTDRTGQSINFYGYFAGNDKITTWFGYGFPWWLHSLKIVTPIFIQIKEDFNLNPKFDDRRKIILQENGFYIHAEHGWIKPFPVELFSSQSTLAQAVFNEIEKLTKQLP